MHSSYIIEPAYLLQGFFAWTVIFDTKFAIDLAKMSDKEERLCSIELS